MVVDMKGIFAILLPHRASGHVWSFYIAQLSGVNKNVFYPSTQKTLIHFTPLNRAFLLVHLPSCNLQQHSKKKKTGFFVSARR
jgi:hypothetical protein